jgi:hypothetical protein
MASMTNYLENKIIDWLFRGVSYTPPTIWYVGLLTAAPSDSAAGTEVSGGAYARVAITAGTTQFAATNGATTTTNPSSGTGGTTSNNAAITFPAPSGANWGTCTHLGLYDALTSGNLCAQAPLTAPKTINDGDAAPSFAISALTFQIDN